MTKTYEENLLELSYHFSLELFFELFENMLATKEPFDSNKFKYLWNLFEDYIEESASKNKITYHECLKINSGFFNCLSVFSSTQERIFYLLDVLKEMTPKITKHVFMTIRKFYIAVDELFKLEKQSFKPYYDKYGSFFDDLIFEKALDKELFICLRTFEEERDYSRCFDKMSETSDKFLLDGYGSVFDTLEDNLLFLQKLKEHFENSNKMFITYIHYNLKANDIAEDISGFGIEHYLENHVKFPESRKELQEEVSKYISFYDSTNSVIVYVGDKYFHFESTDVYKEFETEEEYLNFVNSQKQEFKNYYLRGKVL